MERRDTIYISYYYYITCFPKLHFLFSILTIPNLILLHYRFSRFPIMFSNPTVWFSLLMYFFPHYSERFPYQIVPISQLSEFNYFPLPYILNWRESYRINFKNTKFHTNISLHKRYPKLFPTFLYLLPCFSIYQIYLVCNHNFSYLT